MGTSGWGAGWRWYYSGRTGVGVMLGGVGGLGVALGGMGRMLGGVGGHYAWRGCVRHKQQRGSQFYRLWGGTWHSNTRSLARLRLLREPPEENRRSPPRTNSIPSPGCRAPSTKKILQFSGGRGATRDAPMVRDSDDVTLCV